MKTATNPMTMTVAQVMGELSEEVLHAELEVAPFLMLPKGSPERREAFRCWLAAGKELADRERMVATGKR